MFDSVFATTTSVENVFLMTGIAIVLGVIYSALVSLKMRASKSFFVTLALLPLLVSLAIAITGAFLQGLSTQTQYMARLLSFAIALGLIRFRSVNGRAEELLLLLGSVIGGLILGLGYLMYGAIILLALPLLYLLFMYTPLFKNRQLAKEKMLKITIPESLDYSEIFNETFAHYLKEHELVGVKTTGMGSMFRLSYRIVLKNPKEEKELIDELRIKNGNLEISILPYVEENKEL